MINKKGYSAIEVIIVLAIIGLIVSLTISNFSGLKLTQKQAINTIVADLSTIQTSALKFQIDKNIVPDSFGTSGFTPEYLMVPRITKQFDSSYGTGGYNLGKRTGQSSPNNGSYVCFRKQFDGDNKDYIDAVMTDIEELLQTQKFYYNTSCPSTSNYSSLSTNDFVYGTYWISRY